MVVRVGILVLAAFYLALGALMVVDPHDFYVELAPFGPRNDHYARDLASFHLAAGSLLLLSWRRMVAWRAPLLMFAAIQFALHSASHLYDIDHAHPHWLGGAEFAELAVATLVIAWLARAAQREAAS